MKLETYEKAQMLQSRITHISQVREILNQCECSESPVDNSSLGLWQEFEPKIQLNTGEIEIIKRVLEEEHTDLLREFAKL